MESVPERYVFLALRLGRWIEGLVDAYIGPEEIARAVRSEPKMPTDELAEEAARLRAALPDADLEPQRVRWLDAQLAALATTASRLAGESIAWADEVERCFGVRPRPGETEELRRAHDRLASVLPGAGDLRERYIRWTEQTHVPRDLIIPALEALRDPLRERAHSLVSLPEEETVAYTLVENKPWLAYNWYQGDFRGRIEVNVDLPMPLSALPLLAAHEAYPGHHTERVAKEARLLRGKGAIENSVAVLTAPEAVVSEGIAMIALEQAFDDPHWTVSEILRTVGVDYEPELMSVVYECERAFDSVSSDAAALLHGERQRREDVLDHICRWSLAPRDVAEQRLSFIEDPTFRAYVSAYTDGSKLCSRFAQEHADGFERLLTEQLTTVDLLEALS